MVTIKSFKDFIVKYMVPEGLDNIQIKDICEELNIKNFKGTFMRNELDKKATSNECLILNLDHYPNPDRILDPGTHWVCLFISNDVVYYFDSYGYPPPLEVCEYCENETRYRNSFPIQIENEVICGHYCIYMLYKLSNGNKFNDILDELYRYNH